MMKRFWSGFKHWWRYGLELQQPHRDIKGMIALVDRMELDNGPTRTRVMGIVGRDRR